MYVYLSSIRQSRTTTAHGSESDRKNGCTFCVTEDNSRTQPITEESRGKRWLKLRCGSLVPLLRSTKKFSQMSTLMFEHVQDGSTCGQPRHKG
ncbi:hypothetical protein Q5P01_023672 [Channa striata]|uniref:Uncharacterized protein n=1 Tax=Channa striata TaxID=64152 RepID=A0AA88LLC3_CHASR|nr:hypothetical protein Q5P01_023672 [Channa striata]